MGCSVGRGALGGKMQQMLIGTGHVVSNITCLMIVAPLPCF